jgi:putative ABC transport system permease protein
METLLQDIRYGLRLLLRSPGFTAVAIMTLALGIGANTAIFSVVNTVLLRSLPYQDPDRLVKIIMTSRGVGGRDIGLSVPELDDLKSRAGIFDQVSVTWPADANLTGAERPERLEMMGVSPNYFSMLGAKAQLGRVFGSQDEAQGFAEGVVISDSLWRRSFGKDPNILGHKLQLDNDPYTIVGVLPPEFRHPGTTLTTDVDIWATAGFRANPFPKPTRIIRLLPGAIGRLKPGISLDQAQARLDTFSRELRTEYPDDYAARAQWSVEIKSLQESLIGDVRTMLWVVMGAVILIILIASVNIANLLLARASGRQREMAMRRAIGATSGRMVRQMLTESVILSLVAGVIGIVTAIIVLRFVLQFVPAKIPRLNEVGVDWTVLIFALLISVLTGLIFGLAPAIQATKADLVLAIREGSKGSGTSARTSRTRGLLIAAELALAVVLMVSAGLLLRTFWGLLQENPGFNPSGVVTANIWIPVPNDPRADKYARPEAQATLVREILRRVSALPGVEMAGLTTDLPVTHTAFRLAATVEDHPVESSEDITMELSAVTPDYFKVMQVPLVRGRFITENDGPNKDQVVLIDETMARRFWPNQDPLGKRCKIGVRANSNPWMTVVGIVKDIKNDGLDADKVPHIYGSLYQLRARAISVALRTSLSSTSLEPQIRHELQAVDPALPIFNLRSMDEVIGASLARRRFSAELVGVFAALALLLASIGIYGLLAYMVGQRLQEIGIRMAMGAQPSHILKMILTQGVKLAGAGILVGMIFAGFAAPLISSMLYGVRPVDPAVFVTVPLVLVIVALLASYIPARRATKVDPIIALRNE